MGIRKIRHHLLTVFQRQISPTKDYFQIKQQSLVHLHQAQTQSKETTVEKAVVTAMQVTMKMELAINLAKTAVMMPKDQVLGWSMVELLVVDQLQAPAQPLLEVP